MILERRKENYECLESALRTMPEIELLRSSYGEFQSSYYCLSIILKKKFISNRFEIVSELKTNGIGTSVYYPRPVPHMSYYREKYGYIEDSYPFAARISYGSIALSVGPHLNKEDMLYTAETLKKVIVKFN
jgi:perosamine synthetase